VIGYSGRSKDGRKTWLNMIVFDEFHHFAPGQLRLLEQAGRSRDVIVTFPAVAKKDALFAPYLESTRTALQKLASKIAAVKARAGHAAPEIQNVEISQGAVRWPRPTTSRLKWTGTYV
jgi:hypothetical protein